MFKWSLLRIWGAEELAVARGGASCGEGCLAGDSHLAFSAAVVGGVGLLRLLHPASATGAVVVDARVRAPLVGFASADDPLFEAFKSPDAVEIRKRISLKIPGVTFPEGGTRLFIDEIRECPKARAALKLLARDESIDVIASGSLLGIGFRQSEIVSIPVGYERQVDSAASALTALQFLHKASFIHNHNSLQLQ